MWERPRRVSDRYVYILEMKTEHDPELGIFGNEWLILAGPFYGQTRIEARRLALQRLEYQYWNRILAFGTCYPMRVKGIRIHTLNC